MAAEPRASFSDLLRQARRNAGLTQEELAERAGLSVRAVSNLERGINRAPHRDTLDMLARALDLSPMDRARWEQTRSRESGRTSISSPRIPVHSQHLPVSLTSFIGREREIDEVNGLLRRDETRLLTLTGAGGIGKTRLSVMVAGRLSSEFADGVHFVPLANVTNPELIPAAIAQVLDVRATSSQAIVDAITRYLRDRDLLLLLDNFEHVIAGATVVATLLAESSQLTVLATSRVPLRLTGEQEYSLRPLDADASARLFVERLQSSIPDFRPQNNEVEAITAICRRLDGLPLAIELAAARGKVLPPAALLRRLERPLDILINGPRDLPSRQQTLRSTIGWSYNLLDPAEQSLFRALSVFIGGWTLEAVEAVGESDALDALSKLVEISLVERLAEFNGQPRYRMLETVREFGQEMLRAHNTEAHARECHARYVSGFLSSAPPFLIGPQQIEWLDRIEQDHANALLALDWCLEHDIETGLRLLATLWTFWWLRTPITAGRQYFDRFLALVDDATDPEAVALALIGAGVITVFDSDDWDRAAGYMEQAISILLDLPNSPKVAYWAYLNLGGIALRQGDLREAEALYRLTIDYSQRHRQPIGQAVGLLMLGNLLSMQGDTSASMDCYNKGLTLTREIQDPFLTASHLGNIGRMLTVAGEFEAARPLLEESLEINRAIRLSRRISADLEHLADIELFQGNLDEAAGFYSACFVEATRINDAGLASWGNLGLGRIALKRGHPEEAVAHFRQSLDVSRSEGDHACVANSVEGLAVASSHMGNLVRAVQLHAWAAAFRDQLGIPQHPQMQPEIQRDVEQLRLSLAPQDFDAAWEEGTSLTLDQIRDGACNDQQIF